MILKGFVVFTFVSLSAAVVLDCHDSLLISAFNVEAFGKMKMGVPTGQQDQLSKRERADVIERLVRIVRRYDIIIIQEIRDDTETAFQKLVREVNAYNRRHTYHFILSRPFGRPGSSYREQYGYIFRMKSVHPRYWFGYDDSPIFDPRLAESFMRQPYIAQFECLKPGCRGFIFNTIVIHTRPTAGVAWREISNLAPVYFDIAAATDRADAVILGDLNADRNYVKVRDWRHITLNNDPRFTWLIPNGTDTSVGPKQKAYDRIITAGEGMRRYSKWTAVCNFEKALEITPNEAKRISDHFPVELCVGNQEHQRAAKKIYVANSECILPPPPKKRGREMEAMRPQPPKRKPKTFW